MGKTLQEIVAQLTGMDDIFFFKLAEDRGFCEELLQVILANKEIRIVEHKPQAVLRNIKGRSVTLDLKCVGEDGVVFGVEVQKQDNDNHQKRVRYNMANIDTAESEKGVKFDELKEALNEIGVMGITVTQVLGCGTQKGMVTKYRGAELDIVLLPKMKVEVVVSAIPVETVIETAKKVLYTGNIGDGKIFVYDVENVIKVRTGEEGFNALQGETD